MKSIIAAIAAAISFAAAAASLQAPNQAGGLIVITDQECPGSSELKYAFATTKDGTVSEGCWVLMDGLVQVYWIEHGVKAAYPVETLAPAGRRKGGDV